MAGEEDDDDDDDTDGEMMAVEGQDGQQYVVLEVIQLQVKCDVTDRLLVICNKCRYPLLV